MPDVAIAERTLPHNLEAERSVLGAVLLHNDAFNLAAEVIDASDFFRDAHRRIFDKMIKLSERGDAIDLVTLTVQAQVGKDDKMFGSVTTKDIAEGLAAQGITVDRRKIQLADPLKTLGEHTVPVKLHRQVTVQLKVIVTPAS